MFKLAKIAVLVTTVCASGCASIISDKNYPVYISGDDGLKYTVKTEVGQIVAKGSVPNTVTLPAGAGYFKASEYMVNFKSDCNKGDAYIESSLDGWYVANLLFGGLIGLLVVDPSTGAMWKLEGSVNSPISNDCNE